MGQKKKKKKTTTIVACTKLLGTDVILGTFRSGETETVSQSVTLPYQYCRCLSPLPPPSW